jgi:hypothetical protein
MTGTNNMLQTTRELNIKNYSLIRNSIRNKIKKNTTRNNSITKCNISTGKVNNRNQSVGRNRKNDISKINDSSSNKMSKNDSLTKFNEINYRKKLIKGIQIKNFSKIFNINNHSKIEKKKKNNHFNQIIKNFEIIQKIYNQFQKSFYIILFHEFHNKKNTFYIY